MKSSPAEWRNWSGALSATPERFVEPACETELAELLATTSGEVRTVGSSHSCVPLCATERTLVSLGRLQGVVSVDAARGRAEIRGGTELHRLGEPLREHGLALANMGDIDRQSLAGALATGTHGTGRGLGVLATQVVGLRLLLASGEPLLLDERSPELSGAAVSLGALGVVTHVTLQLVPAYRLHERMWKVPFDACLGELPERVDGHRHFELFYFPERDRCAMKTLDPTEAPPDHSMPYDPSRFEGERIDWSDRIFPSERSRRFNEIEYALPAAAGPDCLRALRRLLKERFPAVAWPLEYRTVAADELWLSPAHGRRTVTIAAHEGAERPHEPFFTEVEAVLRDHAGRPHWGKWHTQRAAQLRSLYPRFEDFLELRSRLDPDRRFSSRYLRDLLGLA